MSYEYRTLILTAEVTPLAQQIAVALAGEAGAGMWSTPLAPTAEGPATHYISSGMVGDEFAYMVPLQVWEQDEAGQWQLVSTEPGSPEAVTAACNQAGLEVTMSEVEAVFTGADVTAQDPFVAMARLGLVMVYAQNELFN